MKAAKDLNALANDLEAALNGLVKLVKALSFYPSDHPSLATAVEDAGKDFQAYLQHQKPEPCHVSQEGFSLNNQPLAQSNENLTDLAVKLVERRVHQLLFLPQLENHELLMFAEEIASPAAGILNSGGLAKRLAARQINTIWINESNLQTILDKLQGTQPQVAIDSSADQQQPLSEQLTSGFEPPPQPQLSTTEQMRETLEQLKTPQPDQTYHFLLEKVRQLSAPFFSETGLPGLLAVFNLLENHRKDSNRPTEQKQAAAALGKQLLTEINSKRLIEAVGDLNLKASQRRLLTRLLVSLGSNVALQMLQRLYSERDAIVRRYYSSILAQMGENIFYLLRQDLHHATWHRVRNVVTILGETRLETALPLLSQVTDYPEVRVRRAVIRALVAIGGNSVIPLLLRFADDPDAELHHPAIMALGTLRNSQAIPPLVEILKKPDPRGKQTALKTEVIQALAATRSPRAIIPLLKMALRLNLLNRKNVETLRAEAILALGHLGNDKLIPVLKQLPKVKKEPASRALKQATTLLQKQQHHVA